MTEKVLPTKSTRRLVETPIGRHRHDRHIFGCRQDYVPKADSDPENLPEHHRESYKRRVTAILPRPKWWPVPVKEASRS